MMVIRASLLCICQGRLQQIDSVLADAIDTAYDQMGVVVDDRASYVWTRGTRALSKNLTFEEQQAKTQKMA